MREKRTTAAPHIRTSSSRSRKRTRSLIHWSLTRPGVQVHLPEDLTEDVITKARAFPQATFSQPWRLHDSNQCDSAPSLQPAARTRPNRSSRALLVALPPTRPLRISRPLSHPLRALCSLHLRPPLRHMPRVAPRPPRARSLHTHHARAQASLWPRTHTVYGTQRDPFVRHGNQTGTSTMTQLSQSRFRAKAACQARHPRHPRPLLHYSDIGGDNKICTSRTRSDKIFLLIWWKRCVKNVNDTQRWIHILRRSEGLHLRVKRQTDRHLCL